MGTLIIKISSVRSAMKVVRPAQGLQFTSAPNVRKVGRLTVPIGVNVGLTSSTKAVNVSAKSQTI